MKPLWRVTFRWTNIAIFAVMLRSYQPTIEVRVYRWKWRAKLAVFLAEIACGQTGICPCATIEKYWPDASNVVPLRPAA